MELNDNVISSYINYFDIDEDDYYVEEFKNVLDDAMQDVCQHLNMNLDYEIGVFGAINTCNLISQNEPILFNITINDIQIYNNVIALEKVKSINKKSKFVSNETIKLLLTINLEKKFGEINEITIDRNSININLLTNFGFKAKIYIFASNFDETIMLESNTGKILKANVEEYEDLIYDKTEKTNYGYLQVVNIIKNICEKAKILQNPFIVETLLYNVPDKYYEGDLRTQVIKSVNYINYSNISKFNSIINTEVDLSEDYFTTNSIFSIYKDFENLMKILRS